MPNWMSNFYLSRFNRFVFLCASQQTKNQRKRSS